jgi:hypothetical protein
LKGKQMPQWSDNNFAADNSSRGVSTHKYKSEVVSYPKNLSNPTGDNIFCAGRVLGMRRRKTEVEKLNERLEGVKNFNIFPGEKFAEATPEQIARSINRALDAPKTEYREFSPFARFHQWLRSRFYW